MDQELEDAIERAGRMQVLSYMQSMGWPAGTPLPKHMWWTAVAEVSAMKERARAALDGKGE